MIGGVDYFKQQNTIKILKNKIEHFKLIQNIDLN